MYIRTDNKKSMEKKIDKLKDDIARRNSEIQKERQKPQTTTTPIK